MQRSPVALVVLAAAATALALVMLVWAASAGPGELVTGGPRAQTAVPTATATATPQPTGARHARPVREHQPRTLLDLSWLGETIEVALLLLVGLGLWRLGRRVHERLMEGGAAPRLAGDFAVLPDPAHVADALAAGREEHLARLLEGTPRNGIVQCWMLFEEAATRQGLPPLPTETPTEFLVRLLHRLDVDPRPAARLAGLYHLARFSSHPLSEDDRASARQALLDLHDGLGSPATGAGVIGMQP